MKVFLRTYGCRANHYDSEQIRALLGANSVQLVDAEEDADVGIFNSCSVTADAEADLRQGIRRAVRRNAKIRNIVTGCAAGRVIEGREEETLLGLPNVAGIVAPADITALASVLKLPHGSTRARAQSGARALLRIQDGCDEHCTFCITTIARGNNRSRGEQEVLREAVELAEAHPEIVLTGTHIGSYGSDTGSSLSQLVDVLIRQVPGVRFRLSSLEATEVDDRLLEMLQGSAGALTPYLHAPLQSGSDRVLKRMGRNWYNARSYRDRIEKVVSGARVFGLGADVITGFPGESDDDHRMTVSVVDDLPFTTLHVFPFSERAGTAALRMKETVPNSVARERAAELRSLALAKLDAYVAERVQHAADVVVVSRGRGLTEDFLEVAVSDARERGTRFKTPVRKEGSGLVADYL